MGILDINTLVYGVNKRQQRKQRATQPCGWTVPQRTVLQERPFYKFVSELALDPFRKGGTAQKYRLNSSPYN